MTPQTEIFQHLVRAQMRLPPAVVTSGTSIGEVLSRMNDVPASFVVVTDRAARPIGIVTEQDVVRRVVWQADPAQPVEEVMTAPVVAVQADDYLFQAIAFLRRRKLSQAPVVDGSGGMVGIITLEDALASLSSRTVSLIEQLTCGESIEDLRRVKQAQVELANALLASNAPAPEVQLLLTEINTDIHRRVLRRLEAAMREDGWGDAPAPYALIIMGSGGRGENFLGPDQDNGFIIADDADARQAGHASYFQELAKRMTTMLDAVGFPLCKGDVMATNPLWRQSASQWCRQIDTWLRKCEPEMLLNCDIFFDFRHAYGDTALSRAVRAHVNEAVPSHPAFLRHLFSIEAHHTVALGWFGRLRKERDGEDREGMVNLKMRGTLPLVEGVRLLSLKAGIPATSTLARLAGLKAMGAITDTDCSNLTDGFHHITRLLLRQQLEDFTARREISNFVPESRLSSREKRELVTSFRAIEALRETLKVEFSDSMH